MPGGMNLWESVKAGAANGVLAGGYPFSRNQWYIGTHAPTFGQRVDTLAQLFALMTPGDIAFLGPGAYNEGNLVIPATLTNVTFIGAGNRGAVFIEPSVAGDEGIQVLADDVTLINIGVADGGSGDYGLSVGSQNVSPDRFRAYGCKFEGSAVAARLYGAGDILLQDCEFAWANVGLQLRSNDIGFVTQAFIQNCRFHNNATACLRQFANAQQVNNLQLWNNIFDQLEDGTEPIDFILLEDNGNIGIIAGNQFALATNSAAKLTIGTGLMWGANATEAGWSTARPA
jgi:hypothetical protein